MLIISSAAVVTILPAPAMAAAIVIPGIIGAVNSFAALLRLGRGTPPATHWTDYLYYGALPGIGHLWLIVAAWAVWRAAGWAPYGVALSAMALLLIGIRDAWDLATWLVYNKKG